MVVNESRVIKKTVMPGCIKKQKELEGNYWSEEARRSQGTEFLNEGRGGV